MIIRDALEADLPTIVEIYNATVPTRMVTAELEPTTVEARLLWFREHSSEHYPFWVAESEGRVIAWLDFKRFLPRRAYRGTAEISVYVDEKFRRSGVGQRLLQQAIARAPSLGITALVGLIFGHNEPSLKLFQRFGFERWGFFPAVAQLDGVKRDLVVMGRQKKLIAIEPGGSVKHKRLGTRNILRDLERNLDRQRVSKMVTLIKGRSFAPETISAVHYALGSDEIGVLILDADAGKRRDIECYRDKLADECWMVIDDYSGADSNVKSAPSRADVDALVAAGALEPLGFYGRSEDHTSELQSQSNLVCRLLLEKKKTQLQITTPSEHSRFTTEATARARQQLVMCATTPELITFRSPRHLSTALPTSRQACPETP